jgi:hypothetical protein
MRTRSHDRVPKRPDLLRTSLIIRIGRAHHKGAAFDLVLQNENLDGSVVLFSSHIFGPATDHACVFCVFQLKRGEHR